MRAIEKFSFVLTTYTCFLDGIHDVGLLEQWRSNTLLVQKVKICENKISLVEQTLGQQQQAAAQKIYIYIKT